MKLICSKLKHKTLLLAALALLFISLPVIHANETSSSQGSKVLALFKATDGYSKSNNPIKWHFEKPLRAFGLKVTYHNFNSSIPDSDNLKGVRAIISFYNSGVVKNKSKALRYIKFLSEATDRGIKVVIINSFGAYGYKSGNNIKWDLANNINYLFNQLGFALKGHWTNNPRKLRIIKKNSMIVEYQAKQSISKSKHYQKITPMLPTVKSHLIIKRTDRVKGLGNGNSSVILTSPKGGFALESYVLRNNKLLLNPKLFLKQALFHTDNNQQVAIIIGNIKRRQTVKTNIRYALQYAKIQSHFISKQSLKKKVLQDLLAYNTIILAVADTSGLSINTLRKYLARGGNLLFLRFCNPDRAFKKLIGLSYYPNKKPEDFKGGFTVSPSFFMNNIFLNNRRVETSAKQARVRNVKILGWVLNKKYRKKYPLLWLKKYRRGKILYWNTDMVSDSKSFRGTIVQSIHHLNNGFISAMANIGLMQIDDFPAPLWNINYRKYRIGYYKKLLSKITAPAKKAKLRRIIRNLHRYSNQTDSSFIKNIWLKDMIKFQKKYGFKYSTYLIFNYNKKTEKNPILNKFVVKDFYLAADSMSVKMGLQVLKNGWELGLHGFNHMSLTRTRPTEYDSVPWDSMQSMLQALNVAKREWQLLFTDANLPFSYVAPHNIIDASGIKAVARVFPSIKTISALYISTQGETIQEYEWTKDKRFFQIPRITSGFKLTNSDRYNLYDMLHNTGIISHFIHPDDVFDRYRSSGFAGWRWMKKQFTKEFSLIKKNYPYIRWMTTKDAFFEFLFFNNTKLNVQKNGKVITVITSGGSNKYLFFRMSLKKGQKIKRTINCKIVKANYKTGDIVFKTRSRKSKILLR